MTTCAIHQPAFFPWLGYLHKMQSADVFVFLDDAQFEKGGWQNRNRLKGPNGPQWITVPVTGSLGAQINEVMIDRHQYRTDKQVKTVQQLYRKAPAFEEVWPHVEFYLTSKRFTDLAQMGIDIVQWLCGITQTAQTTARIKSSELNIGKPGASERLAMICERLDADTYLSGEGALGYLSTKPFEARGIKVLYQHTRVIEYPQRYANIGFMHGLSALDALFNIGPAKTADLIKRFGVFE